MKISSLIWMKYLSKNLASSIPDESNQQELQPPSQQSSQQAEIDTSNQQESVITESVQPPQISQQSPSDAPNTQLIESERFVYIKYKFTSNI